MPVPKQHQALWETILDFELDDPQASFSFTDRLMRENDWPIDYAVNAIIEYKKFMFLIATSNQPQTPSDAIDQVWHLHLLYTQSYWHDFCRDVLKMEVHHGPTKGSEEKGHFRNLYEETKALYEQTFDQKPPEEHWPSSKIRFGEIRFSRVNRHRYWLIPKLKFKR